MYQRKSLMKQNVTDERNDQNKTDESTNQDKAGESSNQDTADGSTNQDKADESTNQDTADESTNQDTADESTNQDKAYKSTNQDKADYLANQDKIKEPSDQNNHKPGDKEEQSNTSTATCSETVAGTERLGVLLLSWNIEGLGQDDEDLVEKTIGACDVILQLRPDIILLQEVIPVSEKILRRLCSQYEFIPASNRSYYTAVMLYRDTVTYISHSVIPFLTTRMGRSPLHVTVRGVDVVLMTSHLESMKVCSIERVRQLKTCFFKMSEADPEQTVFFGGDLNIRDYEVKSIGRLPYKIYDVWEKTGRNPETRFSWDCSMNDNLDMDCDFKPRIRFDRIYVRPSKPRAVLKPVKFEFVGMERLEECEMFISDHWGLLAQFDKVSPTL